MTVWAWILIAAIVLVAIPAVIVTVGISPEPQKNAAAQRALRPRI